VELRRKKRTGPVSYNTLRRRAEQHRATDLLVAIAQLNVHLQAVEFDRADRGPLPASVQPFALAGVARTALVSGQDRFGSPVTQQDLIALCRLYGNIDDPALDGAPGMERMRFLFTKLAYEQFGGQLSLMENVGRTLVLLEDHAASTPGAPTAADWAAGLGVTLEHYMRIGFMMHVAAASNAGVVDVDLLKRKDIAALFTPATADEALAVVDRWFAAAPEQLRAAGRAEETRGLQKWALSPLVAHPVVALPDERYVMPWPRLVLDRITPTGLYFIGLELFGDQFPSKLGGMFEHYVGTQLALLEHADLRPEITYGKPVQKTVDHFIITPEAVVLVEVKAARPVRATRLGEPAGDDDTIKKVGYACKQIERTAQLIRDGHPAVESIPADRPLLGLVVTLEPFHLVNTALYDDVIAKPSIPTTVASSLELESFVANLRSAADVGQRLLDAYTTPGDGGISLDDAGEGLPSLPNPLLDEAWERFSAPWSHLEAELGP
jgi:hypothetical protein